MGLKVKNKSTVNTSYTDNSNVAAGGDDSIAVGQGATVNFLDGGAIGAAFDFGNNALDFAGDNSKDAFDFSRGISSAAFDFATHSNDQAMRNLSEGTFQILDKVTVDSGQRIQSVTETFGKYAIYAGVALAALFLFKKG